MNRTFKIGSLIICSISAHLMADGKMFWKETVPPTIPYQRALILHRDGVQTLFLQSKYEIPEQVKVAALGWVVPVPAVPEVASLPAENARQIFWRLSFRSRPSIMSIGGILFSLSILGLAGLLLMALVLCVFSKYIPIHWTQRNRKRVLLYAVAFLIIVGILSAIMPALSKSGISGVDVISEHRIGIYDVRVIQSDDAGELIAWLNVNNFQFDDADQSVFDDYINKGWCFVVAYINPSADQEQYEIVSEGLAAPLILRFPIETPVYPLALTGTGGHDTQVLIYIMSDQKMICKSQLTLRFSGQINNDFFPDYLFEGVEPKGFFTENDLSCMYLCKFRDTLKAEQMQQDIFFAPAQDNTPYRERIIKW